MKDNGELEGKDWGWVLLFYPFLLWSNAFVFTTVWNWFLLDVFNVKMTIAGALGMASIKAILLEDTGNYNKNKKGLAELISYGILKPWVLLLFAFIISLFV